MVEIEPTEDNEYNDFVQLVCPICGYDGYPLLNPVWKESARCGRCGYLILPEDYPDKYIPMIKEKAQ